MNKETNTHFQKYKVIEIKIINDLFIYLGLSLN